MNSELSKEIKRVSNLKQNRDKAEAFVEKQAKINLKIREFKNEPLFPENTDQSLAEKKFKTYINDYEIDSLSDLDTLRSLIFNEIFETKLQNEITKLLTDKKYPNDKLTKQLTDIQDQKLSLKVKLGIDREEQGEDELTGLQTLKKRYHTYIQEHKNEFTTICGGCGKILLLRKRVKDFDCLEHPWFAGRWFFNYQILKDVKDNKLSKEDAWRYMCSSSKGSDTTGAFSKEYCIDYIEYCLKNWHEISKHFEKVDK